MVITVVTTLPMLYVQVSKAFSLPNPWSVPSPNLCPLTELLSPLMPVLTGLEAPLLAGEMPLSFQ